MNDNKQSSSNHNMMDHMKPAHNHPPRRKRVYHSLWFWVFLVLMLGSILYYIMSVDFTLAPQRQIEQKSGNNITP